MTLVRKIAWAIVLLVALATALADILAPHSYAAQFRDFISSPPSWQFPLGTDELGRDRFSRLLHGARVSLLLAPAAALLSTVLAALLGGIAAYAGGRSDRLFNVVTDAFLSLPWLFLLLAVRALLPLNVSPIVSVLVTFALLGLLGWPAPARIVRSATRDLLRSDYLLQAQAGGVSRARILLRHLLPNLRPVLLAQFWVAIPVFVLSEANLSLLGLGVTEPLPSWGSLLKELENYTVLGQQPWMLVPTLLLLLIVVCFQILLRTEEVTR
jgi:ABC-type dipeptide/oligopeptide/nickel transport system permease subunit